MAKVLISESKLKSIIAEELKKSDVIDIVKKDKDIEKYVKDITAHVLDKLFQVLWQQKSFYQNSITK
jgi:predicted CoA-binding protein